MKSLYNWNLVIERFFYCTFPRDEKAEESADRVKAKGTIDLRKLNWEGSRMIVPRAIGKLRAGKKFPKR